MYCEYCNAEYSDGYAGLNESDTYIPQYGWTTLSGRSACATHSAELHNWHQAYTDQKNTKKVFLINLEVQKKNYEKNNPPLHPSNFR